MPNIALICCIIVSSIPEILSIFVKAFVFLCIMKLLRFIALYLSLLFFYPFAALSQNIVPRHEGLASDAEYMELLRREADLTAVADSIRSVIAECRRLLAEHPYERENYASDILRLEGELFEVRNNLGMVTTRTNTIEQEYIVRNISAVTHASEAEKSDFFAENLSDGERRAIGSLHRIDTLFLSLGRSLERAVTRGKEVYRRYISVTERSSADSLIAVFGRVSSDIDRLDRALDSEWRGVYDTLRYAYERMLDKADTPQSMMEPVVEMSRNLRSSESEASSHYAAPALAMYGRQRRMLSTYERLLAERLQMVALYDSLDAVLAEPPTVACDYPALVLPQRVFVSFAPVVTGAAGAMSAGNPPKPLVVPSYGELFKIELLTSNGMLTDYKALRNVNDVEYREIAGDRFVYYAGSYRSREEAARDCDRLRRTGMKVQVAAWRDGAPVDENGVPIEERPVGDIFRVIVYSMDDTARDIIREIAPDKDLLATETDDDTVISVGPFEDYQKALFLAKSLPKAKVIGQRAGAE